ncbi:single-stranded DNA-binding protein [Nocardia cyriacigeorgica]|uniref:Single-stranded DNA-binding protein n=1 Tax=Nocardia cyriacigeorgica (strain GUH-2) TaxID=1127134 RepID=H6R5I0_NOCCG|nr:single-stranded DNA-binding protein [Nocardia cyriacigeorgica]CCF62111.1 Single-strand DNA binding protein (modular protein) [Nocardia cyriacigeorgica GUH-2]
MYETFSTVVGTVATQPVTRELPGGEQVLTFRMASTSRRLDRDSGDWVDSGTLFLTVSCWRKLVAGVQASIGRGDPIIAHGQLRTNEYRTRDGVDRRDLEMRASAIGPDLSRCTAVVRRRHQAAHAEEPGMGNTAGHSGADGREHGGDGQQVAAEISAQAPPRTPDHEPVGA